MLTIQEKENINSIINNYMNPFLNSFPKALKKTIAINGFVAGGAFVSMINDEEPNDIDLFISDYCSFEKVFKFISNRLVSELNYLSEGFFEFDIDGPYPEEQNSCPYCILRENNGFALNMTTTNKADIYNFYAVNDTILKKLYEYYTSIEKLEVYSEFVSTYFSTGTADDLPKTLKAGFDFYLKSGAIIDENIVSLYNGAIALMDVENECVHSMTDIKKLKEKIEIFKDTTCKENCKIVIAENNLTVEKFSSTAITFVKNKVQLVYNNTNLPENVLNTFDFLHTMIYKHLDCPEVYCSEETEKAIREKQLVFNFKRPLTHGYFTQENRFCKFLERGFTLSDDHKKEVESKYGLSLDALLSK